MRPDPAVHPFAATASKVRRQKGYTLIEILLTIGIFSLIVVGTLSIYTTVIRQKNVMLAAADASAIRSALPRAPCTSTTGGIQWGDLERLLPHRLSRAAVDDEDKTLDSANPWSGAYILDNLADSRDWVLQIQGAPENLWDFLDRQLEAIISDVDIDPDGCVAGNYCIGFKIEVDLETCSDSP